MGVEPLQEGGGPGRSGPGRPVSDGDYCTVQATVPLQLPLE